MNVAINHCNNKTGDLVADRNHIDTHIILQCYGCLKPSLPVHYCFKITDAISLAIRFYSLMSIKKHIFTLPPICMCVVFCCYFDTHFPIQLVSCVILCILFYALKKNYPGKIHRLHQATRGVHGTESWRTPAWGSCSHRCGQTWVTVRLWSSTWKYRKRRRGR